MIEYRNAASRDAEAVAQLHARSWRESYRGSFSDEFLDGDLNGERLRVWSARLAEPSRNQLVQLALDGTDLAGFVCAYGDHDPQWGSFIDNLHVAGTSKRNGIGSSLMRQAGAWLDHHYPELGIYLWALEVNSSARRFYERLGGHDEGVFTTETHGGTLVRSCRYTWPRAAALAAG
jgi:ribosomal protein S18 acetylase RimI-like enzyme